MLYTLTQMGREYEGIPILENACHKFPDNDSFPEALASILAKLGKHVEAIHWADRALEINPNNETIFINRITWLAAQSKDPMEVKALYESWGKKFMDPITDQANTNYNLEPTQNRKLKIGYVSGDLKNHSVRYFIEPFFRGHDRQQFEIHAFMTMAGDEVTELLKTTVDKWHDVQKLDDQALFDLIRKEAIDVLIDLSGHTEGQRLSVFAMRAAPVQVTWFGFMQTLGMKAMDWRLTDWAISPEGTDAHYTEKLWRLDCMVGYAPPSDCEAQYPSPYIRNGYVTMVSMNHTRKISDQALETWREILVQNPNSGLILISSYEDPKLAQSSMNERLEKIGMPMNQVSISRRLSMKEFMSLASVADFALDSFPISGGTTTLHGLWMGLPILTLNDQDHGGMGCATAQTLKGLNLHECVTETRSAYLEKATNWIRNPLNVEKIRAESRTSLLNSHLMAHTQNILQLENFYKKIFPKIDQNQN
jgi:predicted O-linked N-acetylglucosamine transferase (SPINDLY family)